MRARHGGAWCVCVRVRVCDGACTHARPSGSCTCGPVGSGRAGRPAAQRDPCIGRREEGGAESASSHARKGPAFYQQPGPCPVRSSKRSEHAPSMPRTPQAQDAWCAWRAERMLPTVALALFSCTSVCSSCPTTGPGRIGMTCLQVLALPRCCAPSRSASGRSLTPV
jgi:hypothetical protein